MNQKKFLIFGRNLFSILFFKPDQSEILERLSKIREHKRQVLDMMDKLKKNGEEVLDKDMLRKLINAYDNFKEQEEQYLGVLQKILVL